jgi:hypothetical protein
MRRKWPTAHESVTMQIVSSSMWHYLRTAVSSRILSFAMFVREVIRLVAYWIELLLE